MLALLSLEVESENKDELVEFALVAMLQTHAYGKETCKGIFKRFYALLCWIYNYMSNYALPVTIIQGILIPHTYKEVIRS